MWTIRPMTTVLCKACQIKAATHDLVTPNGILWDRYCEQCARFESALMNDPKEGTL